MKREYIIKGIVCKIEDRKPRRINEYEKLERYCVTIGDYPTFWTFDTVHKAKDFILNNAIYYIL